MWGGKVYTSKQQFNGYLKSKGLSYKTWLSRNPGVAPWESAPASAQSSRGESFTASLLLAVIAIALAIGSVLLLSRRRRPITPTFRPTAFASLSRPALRLPAASSGMAARAFVRRVALVGSRATAALKVFVPLYGERIVGAARAEARRVPHVVRDRNISVGFLSFCVVAAIATGLLVASLLSS